jgi:cellulose synthase/poly-beta-1,6-N-acetylglucosamine synthase-like glycosyltransferase/GGDEF domain-containing protein
VSATSVSSLRFAPDPGVEPRPREVILVVSPDRDRRRELSRTVADGGWLAATAGSIQEARWELTPVLPHLVVIDVPDDGNARWALDLIDVIRDLDGGTLTPIVVVAEHASRRLTIDAFERGADDVVAVAQHPEELIARFEVRLERRPVPRDALVADPATGALTEPSLAAQIEHELERVDRGGRPGVLAMLQLDELPALEARFGRRARDELMAQVVSLIKADSREVDFVGHARGVLALLLPATPAKGGQIRLDRLAQLLSAKSLMVSGQVVQLTPIIGYAVAEPGLTIETFESRAWDAMMHQAEQLDLHPTRWRPQLSGEAGHGSRVGRALDWARTPLQILAQLLLCLVVPFGVYEALSVVGIDITGVVYFFLVISLAMTSAAIWIEGFAALRRPALPDEPESLPSAAAIIAAYLPNEAETVLDTVWAFLRQDYPDLRIILAYNTPTPLPVEEQLHAIAAHHPQFQPLKVEGSVSKAQNVNAALAVARSEITGVFDADHHPDPQAFRRAARWLANGVDVVQGHCLVRNGAETFVSRLVAVEFEAIYAVSHPGRARVHGFGIFGGTNGFWRTDVLKQKRMRGFMLTEDIDSSMRVVERGGTIVSDPGLISRELAPVTFKALWNQRMRWAQGWTQVSWKHLRPMMTRPGATLRNRIGAFYLLAWREVYPWISLQMFPLIVFWLTRGSPPMNWFVPIFVFTTLFTFTAGPGQVFFAWKLGDESIKHHKRWYLLFLAASLTFYTELKNVIVRTAHLKELMGERTWKVTPRSVPVASADPPDGLERRDPESLGATMRHGRPVEVVPDSAG